MASDSVPVNVQLWILDALSHTMLHEIAQFIADKYEGRILREAGCRQKEGYVAYDSVMYNWTPERRLQNVIEELADAVVYMTSGPLPPFEEDA